MVIRVEVRKRNAAEFEVVRDAVNGSFVKATADMSHPECSVVINNREGIWSQKFARNDYLRIYDHEELVFDGKVFETRKNEKAQQLTVIGWKKEYLDLKDTFCMEAELQNGFTAWNWGGEEILAAGAPTINTEGLRPDEIFLAGLGLKTEIQHFFTETDAILLTETDTSLQTSGFTNRDTQKSLEISHLSETSYNASGTIVTKTLTNGLVGFNTAPDVSTVRIRLSGEEPAGTDVEIRVSIDDGVTWSSVISPAYNASTGLWADATFSSIPNNGTENLVKVEIKLFTNGGTADATPRVRYMRATFTHPISDTGVTMGTIDPYEDPDTGNDTAGGDYNKRTRLDVVQGAVKATVAPEGEQYTHWIAWIDENGAAHFRNPATYHNTESGVIFSREAGTCDDIDVTVVGQIINNLVYVGTGIGGGTLVITEADSFAAGILRNAASITLYGEIQGLVTEKNVFSISHADKRARSIARLLSQEQKAIEVKLNPNDDLALDIGQKCRAQSAKLDTDIAVRILEESFEFTAEGLRQRHLVLGNNIPSVSNVLGALRRGMESQNLTEQGARSPPSVSFHDNVDEDHPAEMAFYIPEDARVRRIGLHLKTAPFRTFSRVTAGESAHTHAISGTATGPGSAHTHTITGQATAGGAIGTFNASFNDKTGTMDNAAVGGQALAGNGGTASGQSLTTGNASGQSLTTGSAPGASLASGSTDNNSDVSPGTSQGNSIHSITVSGTSGVETAIGSGVSINTTDDLVFIDIIGYNDSDTSHPFSVRLKNGTSTVHTGGAAIPTDGLTVDSIAPGIFSYIADADTYGSGLNIFIVSAGTGYTDQFMLRTAIIKKHIHTKGSLASAGVALTGNAGSSALTGSAQSSGLTGNTATQNMNANTSLDATTITALFSGLKIGYTAASGGTGSIAFTQSTVDYYEQHGHPITGQATASESAHTHTLAGTATGAGSEHTHAMEHGIFEFDESPGPGKIWPKDIQVYIKDYPSPGNNPNPGSLTVPFDRFGMRGRNDQSIEVQNMDLSVAFREPATGLFKTGFQQVWVVTGADAPNNPKGLGRIDASLFIEQQQDVEK